jgi:hypothetical protein
MKALNKAITRYFVVMGSAAIQPNFALSTVAPNGTAFLRNVNGNIAVVTSKGNVFDRIGGKRLDGDRGGSGKAHVDKPTLKTEVQDVVGDLQRLASIIHVLGFHAEAKRVLIDLQSAAEFDEEFGESLDDLVKSRLDWMEHKDTSGCVLHDVARQLDKLHARLGDAS